MIVLNKDQTVARTALLSFLTDSSQNHFILTGSAGTGKTSTIVQVMHDIKEMERQDKSITSSRWYITATTNKAKQALQVGLPNKEVTTIHSFLGLGMYKGNLVKRGKPKCADGKAIVVIDECSYVDNKLLGFINELSDEVKIIYLGDRNQLTPVRYTHCPVFEQGYPMIALTTPVRQAKAPYIAMLCENFKKYIESNGSLPFPRISLSGEISHVSAEEFNTLLEDVFIVREEPTLHHRVLSYANKVVIGHNTTLFGLANGRTQLLSGDIVVNNHFVKSIKTDEEVIIVDKSTYTTTIPDCNGFTYTIQGFLKTTEVFVPNNPKAALKSLESILEATTHPHKGEAGQLFDMLADLRPMYASTVHKSQGSTFKNVYIDLNSFAAVQGQVALARLLYVAISRASEKVILTGDVV